MASEPHPDPYLFVRYVVSAYIAGVVLWYFSDKHPGIVMVDNLPTAPDSGAEAPMRGMVSNYQGDRTGSNTYMYDSEIVNESSRQLSYSREPATNKWGGGCG